MRRLGLGGRRWLGIVLLLLGWAAFPVAAEGLLPGGACLSAEADQEGVRWREASFTVTPSGGRWTFGLQRVRWGPGQAGALILDDGGSFWGGLREREWDLFGRVFKTTQVVAPLGGEGNRVFFGHRLAGELAPGLDAGVSETALASGAFTPWLYNPLPLWPYYLTQHLARSAGDPGQDYAINCNLAVDVRRRWPSGVAVYSEFYVDDAQSVGRERPVPDFVGLLVGVNGVPVAWPQAARLTVEYTALTNWVYAHKNPLNDYVWPSGTPIGHALGPDADALTLMVKQTLRDGVDRTVRLQWERHGEGELGESWRPEYGRDGWFRSGLIERRLRLGVAEERTLTDRLALAFEAELVHRTNAGHLAGVEVAEAGARGAVQLKF